MARKPQATAKKAAPATSAASELSAAERASGRKVMKEATGTDSKALQNRLVNQALAGVWVQKGEDQDAAILATIAALGAIAPSDGLEGMLAAQMVATHEAAMECLRRAMISGQTFEGRDSNLKHATKLTQVYARQMEALAKYRGRGQQKITVEHVNVHAGGQAIVGDIHTGQGEKRADTGRREAGQQALTDDSQADAIGRGIMDDLAPKKAATRTRKQR